jgi:lactoylglutathione lyase
VVQTKVFGLRLVFNYRATRKLCIAYMAHSHGGRNGTGFQTASEMNRDKNNLEGWIERVHYEDTAAALLGSTAKTSTLSYIGLIVPRCHSCTGTT